MRAAPGRSASLGLQAISVDKPDQVGPAWDQALSADRPTLLDVRPKQYSKRNHTAAIGHCPRAPA
jgi:thiamine pyrophosphate-dependent acetolactate synthase large subunit-like protein